MEQLFMDLMTVDLIVFLLPMLICAFCTKFL